MKKILPKRYSRLQVWVVALVSAVVFFALGFSAVDNVLKFLLMIADLVLCGVLIHKLTGIEEYYGALIVRGVHGFRAMQYFAEKFAKQAVFISELGLTIGMGLPYGFLLFKRSRNFVIYFLLSLAFFVFMGQVVFGGIFSAGFLPFVFSLALGLLGIGIYFLASYAFLVLTVPATPPGVIPLIPGVTVPWETIPALVIVLVVHELAHGVLAKIEKLQVKSSGLLLFGFLPIGAFVEPDDKKFEKTGIWTKRRVLIAGTTSNTLFFLIFLVVAAATSFALASTVGAIQVQSVNENSTAFGLLSPGDAILAVDGTHYNFASDLRTALLQKAATNATAEFELANGVKKSVRFSELIVRGVKEKSPSEGILRSGEILFAADGQALDTSEDLRRAIAPLKSCESLSLETSAGKKSVTVGSDGKLGIELAQQISVEFKDVPSNAFAYALLYLLLVIFSYTFSLNFILATVNLLPIYITDGDKLLAYEAHRKFGLENAKRIMLLLRLACVGLLLLNALPWFLH